MGEEGDWFKVYRNIYTVESYTKYSIAFQKNAINIYIQIGRDVQDYELMQKEGKLSRYIFKSNALCFAQYIHNLELYEDQNTGKPGNQSKLEKTSKVENPFYS